MCGYEPLTPVVAAPRDNCHAPCGWTATCEHPDDCEGACREVVEHEATHLDCRVWLALHDFTDTVTAYGARPLR